MKIKPTRNSGGIVLELGPNEPEIPGVAPEAKAAAARFRLQHILVPIDFSACSKKALRYALPLARQFGAHLTLLFVGQGFYLVPELAPLDLTQTEPRADITGKLAALAREEIGDQVLVEILVRNGHAPTEIVRAATETAADLIVISTHGYTGLKHAWFGSMTENVVRHAPCPVLVVREEEREFLPSQPAT